MHKKNTVYILNRVLFVYSGKLFLFLSFLYSDTLLLFFLYPNTYFLFDIWIIFFLQYHPVFYRLGCEGRKMERLSDDEYIKKLSEVCDIGNLREILEKAAFSAEDISESELLCCLYIMNEIASKIRAERSLHCLYFELNLLQNFVIEKTK